MAPKNFTFVLLISFLLFYSCSSSNFRDKNTIGSDFKKWKDETGESWIRKISFLKNNEAKEYMLNRKLSLQRLYEITSEPYFGLPAAVDCKDNIDTKGELIKIAGGEFFSLKLLSNNKFALGDCLKENNDLQAIYQFYLCDKDVYEYRHYIPLEARASAEQILNCD